MRLRYRLVTLIIAFAPMMSPAGARGDELQVRKTEFSPSSGTVIATISALGPPDTAIAVRLYRHGCPANPEGEDVQPGLTANGQSYEVPALADEPGVSGNWYLCIWTIHENGAVGARYQHLVRLPKPPPPAWSPVIGTNHPWWWAFVGWSTLLAFIAVLVGAGLSRRVLRRSRRRHGRTQDPFGNPLDRNRGPNRRSCDRPPLAARFVTRQIRLSSALSATGSPKQRTARLAQGILTRARTLSCGRLPPGRRAGARRGPARG